MNLPSGFSGDVLFCCLLTAEEKDSDHEMQSETKGVDVIFKRVNQPE